MKSSTFKALYLPHFLLTGAPLFVSLLKAPHWFFLLGHALFVGTVWLGAAIVVVVLVREEDRRDCHSFNHMMALGVGGACMVLHAGMLAWRQLVVAP